jgi:hypothetical protein
MDEQSPPQVNLRWSIVSVVLLATGWLAFSISMKYGAYLADQFGPCPDVYDALVCAAYVGRRALPWFSLAVLLDGLAILACGIASWPPRLWFLELLFLVAAVLSCCIHGFVCALYFIA